MLTLLEMRQAMGRMSLQFAASEFTRQTGFPLSIGALRNWETTGERDTVLCRKYREWLHARWRAWNAQHAAQEAGE